ncbi:uncharacterized protein LOC100375683 [Saccoglossus kowalevskii]|uniref:E3 ubiquitin-protein ligase NRDP1-like n=1 Tax=Saccoglossus kowalevskii TaxID=10224 RepID=A0ABM0GVA3_SACKO|nr:PREDICTED: E3 ubiquitin-protein ligase NRDP1-like [Saccoglossus kowalevskii]
MGYGVQRFVTTPDQNLLCGICSCVVEDAVLTRCGHTFCELCLDTWLTRPNTDTCPCCRGRISKYQVSPVWSLRAIVNSLDIECDHKERGCKMVVRMESLSAHLESCGYAPVECIGCGMGLNRYQLAAHQIQCPEITAAAAVHTASAMSSDGVASFRSIDYQELFCKIASLELQLKRMKRDLEATETKNRKLERELSKVKADLDEKRDECEVLSSQMHDFDPEYTYGYAPESIAQLSFLIARNLLDKPEVVDRNRIFNCIKRCYENYARCGDDYEHDVHMLIATAYASDWFAENHRINFHCWLQSIARYRKYADLNHMSMTTRTSNN